MPSPIQRPGAWWRAPLTPKQLTGIGDDEARLLIAQERLFRTAQLQEKIREVRRYSTDFSAAKGFPLTERAVIRIPAAKLRKLEHAYEQLKRAKTRPTIEITARSDRQKKRAAQQAGKIIPGQKRFLIHHTDADRAKAEWRDGEIHVTTTVKGGELYERLYLFSRRPRSWREVIKQTQALQRRGMRTGNYKIFNSLYGPIGELVSRDKLVSSLEQFFSAYNRWLAGTILGWIWMGTSLDTSRKRQRREKGVAERFLDQRRYLAQREQDRIKKRLGLRVPKRRKAPPPAPIRRHKRKKKAPRKHR